MTKYITTLKQIRNNSPCEDGWKKLLIFLGKKKADQEPLDILTILKSNGIDDAIWCLRAVLEDCDADIERLAVTFAKGKRPFLPKNKNGQRYLVQVKLYALLDNTEFQLKYRIVTPAQAAFSSSILARHFFFMEEHHKGWKHECSWQNSLFRRWLMGKL